MAQPSALSTKLKWNQIHHFKTLKKESPGPNGVTRKYYQLFKEKLTSILFNLLKYIEEEETFLNSFFTLIQH
jgi:hypothetical protein